MSTTNEPATLAVAQQKAAVPTGSHGLILSDLDSMWRFSTYVAASGLAPKGIQTKEAIFTAIQMGLEVGLTPMAALQNIAVINGRPSIWGDAQLAIVRSRSDLESFSEWYESGGKRLARNPATYTDDTCAVCEVKRRGFEPVQMSFSVSDAKLAKLWGKEGPWSQYPFRMLRFRARSFALRDTFGDALKGMRSVEEAMDAPAIEVSATEIPPPQFLPPAKPAEAAPTPADQPPSVSPQQLLSDLVIAEGYRFDDLQVACGNLARQRLVTLCDEDINATSFDELSADLSQKLLQSKSGMLRALRDVKEGGVK